MNHRRVSRKLEKEDFSQSQLAQTVVKDLCSLGCPSRIPAPSRAKRHGTQDRPGPGWRYTRKGVACTTVVQHVPVHKLCFKLCLSRCLYLRKFLPRPKGRDSEELCPVAQGDRCGQLPSGGPVRKNTTESLGPSGLNLHPVEILLKG